MNNVVQRFLTKNPCYTYNANPEKLAGSTRKKYVDFQKKGPQGLMLHSVGCSQPSAMAFINNWDNPSFDRACVHGFIDANTGVVYQTLPWNYRGWHSGGSSNNTHVGVEMCEPACIKYTGGSTFTCSDYRAAVAAAERTTKAAVELFAQICILYGLDPLKDGVIISHAEGYKRGVASNHGDPDHLWRGLNMNYNMDSFRADVAKIVADLTKPPEEEEEEVRYKYIDDVPSEEFRNVLNTLVKAEILHGTGFEGEKRVIDLSYDMIRNIVFEYRGGAFDRKLIAMGLEPVVKA